MKRWIVLAIAVGGLGTLAAVALHLNSRKTAAEAGAESVADPVAAQSPGASRPEGGRGRATEPRRSAADPAGSSAPDSAAPNPVPADTRPAGSPVFRQAIACLVSPGSNFVQRQAALEQLRTSGKLDLAISEVEQGMAANPQAAEYPAALGRLYLQKCGTIQDIREQGILGMKADQVFEAALNLDPSNWDARFTKAVAMSYWPTQLNKGEEVVQQFTTLIEQQETQPSQPHFALTYVWMGDAYQKYGHPEYAQQIWQRGAALFPDNQELKNKLSPH